MRSFQDSLNANIPNQMNESQNIARIKNEQIRAQQLKDQIDQELRNNKIMGDDLQRRMDGLRSDIFKKEDILAQANQRQDMLLEDKQIFEQDHAEARRQLDFLISNYQERQQQVMNEYIAKNKHVIGLENDFQREMMQIRQENNNQASLIHSHWAPKLASIEEQYNSLLKQNDLTNHKSLKFKEMFLRMRIEHDENVKNLESRFYNEEKDKYQHQMDLLVKKQSLSVADLKTQENKRDEIQQDQERLELNLTKERDYYENEIQLERERIHQFHQKMSKRNIKLEILKNKSVVLDAHLITLTRRIEETNRILITTKDFGIEDIADKRYTHEQSYLIFKQSQAMLHQRIIDLELLLRSSEVQCSRVKGEYDKLCQILTSKVGSTISEIMKREVLR